MWDSILDDPSHQDDPHLWDRARTIGLDLDRFERDRRSDQVAARVSRDFSAGIRAGIAATPAAFVAGSLIVAQQFETQLAALADRAG